MTTARCELHAGSWNLDDVVIDGCLEEWPSKALVSV